MNTEQKEARLASDLNRELDRFKIVDILAKAKIEVEKRDVLAWEIIKKLTYRKEPELFPKDKTLFVGLDVLNTINSVVGYIPLFVKHSNLLENKQSVIVDSFIKIQIPPYKYL